MPRYRFEFLDTPETPPVFAEFPDDEAAILDCRRALAESVLDQALETQRVGVPTIKVYNDAGYLIATERLEDCRYSHGKD